jgi:hypothetical protein
LAAHLAELKKQAGEAGLYTPGRVLLECTRCGLLEDVLINGVLITAFASAPSTDTEKRFSQVGPQRWRCPNCGHAFDEP